MFYRNLSHNLIEEYSHEKRKAVIFCHYCYFTIASFNIVLAENLRKIILLHTNDIHGHMFPYEDKNTSSDDEKTGGFQYLATLINKERSENPGSILLLDGGDLAQGNIYSNLAYGIPVVEIMNFLKYDATVTGNHEFDWEIRRLEEMIEKADFSFLAANVIRKEDGNFIKGSVPYIIKEINGVRLGIIGITGADTSVFGPEFNSEEYLFLAPEETLKKYIPLIRFTHKVDLLIVLSHLGLHNDKKLASKISGIDIIVGSHSHTFLEEPVMENNTIIVQAGKYINCLGRLEIEVDIEENKIIDYKGNLLKVNDSIKPDREVAWLLDNYKLKYGAIAQKVVGINEIELIKSIENETNMGNLFTDSMREFGKADIAMINANAFRENIPVGPVTMEDLYEVYPYDNVLITMDLTGKDIKDILEKVLYQSMEYCRFQV